MPKKEEKKAISKSQQRLFGMVTAYKSGKLDLKKLDKSLADKIKSIADGERRKTGDKRKFTKGISKSTAKEIASTKHDEIPQVVENKILKFNEFDDDKLKGGKADGKTLKDIAELHNISLEYLESILPKAIEIEMNEHTEDEELAKEIAMDHLVETPLYYDDLIGLPNMEDELENMEQEEVDSIINDRMDESLESSSNNGISNIINGIKEDVPFNINSHLLPSNDEISTKWFEMIENYNKLCQAINDIDELN